MHKSDISYGDFNPTLLYTGKYKRFNERETPHNHECMEICFVISGRCGYDIGGTYYIAQPGDILLFNPGVDHNVITLDMDTPSIQFFIGLNDFHMKGMQQNHITFSPDFPIIHTEGEDRQAIQKLCYDIIDEQESCMPGKYFMLRSYLTQFVLHILRLKHEEAQKEYKRCHYSYYRKSHIIKQTITFLEAHYTEKISLDQISQNVYLSPVYISKVFKEETGESPISYLIKIRLEQAKKILEREDEMSIKEVATSVGYDDMYHFSKLFKKYYGISPSHFKKHIMNA